MVIPQPLSSNQVLYYRLFLFCCYTMLQNTLHHNLIKLSLRYILYNGCSGDDNVFQFDNSSSSFAPIFGGLWETGIKCIKMNA